MRELSFSQLWPKLAKPRCTTFRFTRKDKDWYVGETVKVLYKARSPKDRSVLGVAVIVNKEPRWVVDRTKTWLTDEMAITLHGNCLIVTNTEAQADGFKEHQDMAEWVTVTHRGRNYDEPMNKLTLAWTQYWLWVPEQKEHVQKEWAALLAKNAPQLSIYGTGPQYCIQQDVLYNIHNEAALGSMTL